MTFTLRTEFYNNLSNYDVTIKAPEDFTIWATGVLQNASEVFGEETLGRYELAKSSTSVVHVVTPEEIQNGFKHRSGTWHYKAEEVSDFAFGMSDHYAWDAAMQKVEDRQVLINSAFPTEQAEDYEALTAMQQKSMMHLSENLPGVPYPYPVFTSFIGLDGGGMEFPMMANNDGPGRGVTIHEMFHTYFPMYVRINERRFAWMDEGWANFATTQLINQYFEENNTPVYANSKLSVQGRVGTLSDLPLITSSQFMDDTNYGYASYPLPAFIYSMLNHYLGDEMFLKCFRTYINDWAKKSPTPYDFFYSFENTSGEDLTWLWKPWFFEFGYPDVGISSFSKGKLTVENKGTRPVPLHIEVTYENDSTETIVENAKVWEANNSTYTTKIRRPDEVKSISVNIVLPDMDDLDNFYPSISDVYANARVDAGVLGSYKLNEFPFTAVVTETDGVYHLAIPGTGVSTYLVPKEDSHFQSLDGSIHLEFQNKEGKFVGMKMAAFGRNLTSERVE